MESVYVVILTEVDFSIYVKIEADFCTPLTLSSVKYRTYIYIYIQSIYSFIYQLFKGFGE